MSSSKILGWIPLFCILAAQAGETPLEDRFDPKIQDFAFIIPHMKGVRGVPGTGLRAEECGTCHTRIYEEWRASTHASALADIQFQGELAKPDSPKWLCLNCHIPLQDQRTHVVTGLKDGDVLKPATQDHPHFDPKLRTEAITCAVCHVRTNPENGESVVIGAMGSVYAPHPVQKDPHFIRNICARCHNPQGEALTRNLVCWFHTVEELADANAAGLTKEDCVDCHMPEEQRRAVPAYAHLPLRTGHQHHWTGSGVPKRFEGYDSLLERGYESGLGVSVTWKKGQPPLVALSNKNTGHWLPTGDPERFILVKAYILNKRGKILERQSLRIGQHWQWNPAKKLDDNRLKSGEVRSWKPRFQTSWRKARLFRIEALHVRLSSKNAAWLMKAGPIPEADLPNGSNLVAQATHHYPFASYLYREEINLKTGKRVVYASEQLVELSKAERGKSLDDRDY